MKQLRRTIFIILCVVPLTAFGQDLSLKILDQIKLFVEKDRTAIALESADLNGDGTKDYILVTEKTKPQPTDDDTDDSRSLLILIRDQAGKLTLAARNEKVVYCRSCGGAYGDPFDGLEANHKSFTIYNYGGSWQRWGDYYQFNYSNRDRTWQLVFVQKTNYDSHYVDKIKTETLTPKKFGKIDLADFNPSIIR